MLIQSTHCNLFKTVSLRFYTRNENDFDLNIYGFNLKNISQMWKNVIGIGLICIVFGSILIGMKWISNIREQGKKDKKKKKKK